MRFTLWTVGLFCLVDLVASRNARSNEENRQSRISVMGGPATATLPEEFPAVGAINVENFLGYSEFVCSGTLITPSHVLTAAHCLMSSQPMHVSALSVNFTKNLRSDESQTMRRVNDYFVHGNFDPMTLINDIAIIVLSSPITTIPITNLPTGSLRTLTMMEPTENITKTERAELPITQEEVKPKAQALDSRTFSSYVNAPAVIVGWGSMIYGPSLYSNELRKANVTIKDGSVCTDVFSSRFFDPSEMLCTFTPGTDVCHGDAGGPLYVNDVQVGIISYGVGCDDLDTVKGRYVGVYTRITAHLDWIAKIVTSNP